MESVKKDARFAHIAKDPKFRQMKLQHRKVKIDKRFKGMFQDKSFKLKYSVDKRGRPIQATTNEDLRRFYALDDDEEDDEALSKKSKEKKKDKVPPKKESITIQKEKRKPQVKDERFQADFSSESEDGDEDEGSESGDKRKDASEERDSEEADSEEEKDSGDQEDSEEESEEDDSGAENKETLAGRGPDIARGEGLESSSSDEDDEDELNTTANEELEHGWGELDHDAPQVEEATRRLAVCNMDWDHIKAHDLLVLFNSFKPAAGVIRSVHIYPSDYGLARMKEEDLLGPQELRAGSSVDSKAQDEPSAPENEDEKEQREKLRKYQLNRLKYYYAVVECDSVKTANHIYEECDGREYESSAVHLDLRFIPDDMKFDQTPKSVATHVDGAVYKPSLFVNSALQQSKVDCTWDTTDKERLEVTMKKYTKEDLENMDLKNYLASSSDDDEDPYGGIEEPEFAGQEGDEDEETRLARYRDIMSSIKEKDAKKEEKDTELEISWEPGLKETAEKLVKNKKKKGTETVWDQYLEKKKEKKEKKKKKKEKESSDEDSAVSDLDETAITDDEVPSDVDLNDPYFREEMDKMDQKQPIQGKSGNKEKKKRKGKKTLTEEEENDRKKAEAELAMLMEDEEDDKEHFSLKAIQDAEQASKKKKKKSHKQMMKQAQRKTVTQDSFKMDLDDPRFTAVYETAEYNIDPSAPEFKQTKNMDTLIGEKLKRKSKNKDKSESQTQLAKRQKLETKKMDSSIKNLVNSVKSKTKLLQKKKQS